MGVAVDGDGNGSADSLMIFQDGGDWDIFAGLAGVTGVTLGNTAGQNAKLQIVDSSAPEVNAVSFSGTSLTVEYSENISFIQAATHNPVYKNGTELLTISNPVEEDNTPSP